MLRLLVLKQRRCGKGRAGREGGRGKCLGVCGDAEKAGQGGLAAEAGAACVLRLLILKQRRCKKGGVMEKAGRGGREGGVSVCWPVLWL